MTIQIVLLVVLALAAGSRAWVATHDHRWRRQGLVLAGSLGLLAVGQALSLPPVTRAIDIHTTAGMGKIAYNLATMCGLCALLWFFTHATRGKRANRVIVAHGALFVLCAGTMIALMVATPEALRHHSLQSSFTGVPQVPWFYLVGGMYFIYAYLNCAWYVLRYCLDRTKSISPLMRTSLAVIALAAGGLAATAIGREAWVIDKFVSGTANDWVGKLNWQVSNLSFIALAGGLSLLIAADAKECVAFLRRRVRQYRDMATLWKEIRNVYPEVVLRRRLADWFHRRVVECLDGLTRLSPYIGEAAKGADLTRCGIPELARYIWAALSLKPALEHKARQLPAVELPIPRIGDPNADIGQLVALAVSFREQRP